MIAQAGYSAFVIQLQGEFDLAERDRIRDAFAAPNNSAIVVVNMRKTTYIDASVLSCLLELRKATLVRGASLYLVGLCSTVLRLLEITALGALFDVRNRLRDVPDIDAAPIARLRVASSSFS